jgi:hypothetical protein
MFCLFIVNITNYKNNENSIFLLILDTVKVLQLPARLMRERRKGGTPCRIGSQQTHGITKFGKAELRPEARCCGPD